MVEDKEFVINFQQKEWFHTLNVNISAKMSRYPHLKFLIMEDAREFVANFEQKELVVDQFLKPYVF